MHQHQGLALALDPVHCQAQIACQLGLDAAALRCCQAALLQPQPAHLGAHQGSIDAVPGPAAQAIPIAAGLHPTVEQQGSKICPAPHRQIHHQEGQLTDRIDPAQGLAEFQGVEHLDAGSAQQHVAQVQITVALADMAPPLPLAKPGLQGPCLLPHPGCQRAQIGLGPGAIGQGGEVVEHRLQHRLALAPRRLRAGRCGVPMETGQAFSQLPDRPFPHLARGKGGRQQLLLIELHHPHRPGNHYCWGGVTCRGGGGRDETGRFQGAIDRHHIQVALRREAAVEAQLVPAGLLAQFSCGEINKAEGHRLFELVGIWPAQQHPGEVGFKQLGASSCNRVSIGLRAQQLPDHRIPYCRVDGWLWIGWTRLNHQSRAEKLDRHAGWHLAPHRHQNRSISARNLAANHSKLGPIQPAQRADLGH